MKIKLIIVALSAYSMCYFSGAQVAYPGSHGDGITPTTGNPLNPLMASRILRCNKEMKDADSFAVRTWAFILLRMPSHGARCLKDGRALLRPVEISVLEGDIARLRNARNLEYFRFLEQYLPLAQSSNNLYQAHLLNLRTIAGGEVVTNHTSDAALAFDVSTPDPWNTTAMVKVSSKWMMEACSKGAYDQLAQQLVVIGELRRQPYWRTVVIIAQLESEKVVSMNLLTTSASRLKSDGPFVIAAAEFSKNDEASQTACEDLVFEAVNSVTIKRGER